MLPDPSLERADGRQRQWHTLLDPAQCRSTAQRTANTLQAGKEKSWFHAPRPCAAGAQRARSVAPWGLKGAPRVIWPPLRRMLIYAVAGISLLMCGEATSLKGGKLCEGLYVSLCSQWRGQWWLSVSWVGGVTHTGGGNKHGSAHKACDPRTSQVPQL